MLAERFTCWALGRGNDLRRIQMPAAFNALANFTPQGWVLKTWRLVMDGQPVSHLLVPFVVMVALGALLFVMGAMMFKRRYA